MPDAPALEGFPSYLESIHNYIDFGDRIVRKGSIAAYAERPLIIPLNMKDGVVLGFGKSNEDWNNSAPHGAGRKMARTKATRELNVD